MAQDRSVLVSPLEDDRQALFILRHHRRFPTASHTLVEQIGKRILILTSAAREPMDDRLGILSCARR